jgi:hypothetical protein
MPDTPIPSTMSLVSLKGTVSGVGSTRPCSNAIPIDTNIKHFAYFTSQCVFSALTKIDVYDFGGALVDEHVVEVPIADPQDVPAHARGGHAVDVRSAPLVPHGGLREVHFEELMKHRFYLCADGVEVA